MTRGKVNESIKANKSSNKQSNINGSRQTKKKSNAAADQNDSKTGKKVAAEQRKNSEPSAAGQKKSKRLIEWLEPERLALIEGWVRNGVTEKEIAKNMHCSYSTLRKWKTESSALSAALKKNREIADYIVEGALFKKATGHIQVIKKPMKIRKAEYDSETGKKILDYDEIIYVEEEVYIPPDTPAQIFWLKNRCHDRWKDKVEQVIDTEADTAGIVLLAPVLEKNHEPTEESDMGTTTETN